MQPQRLRDAGRRRLPWIEGRGRILEDDLELAGPHPSLRGPGRRVRPIAAQATTATTFVGLDGAVRSHVGIALASAAGLASGVG
jgi:hypothetical protein